MSTALEVEQRREGDHVDVIVRLAGLVKLIVPVGQAQEGADGIQILNDSETLGFGIITVRQAIFGIGVNDVEIN